MNTLYNSQGQATAYIDDDGEYIYLYNGSSVAWISDDAVYAYSGKYLGWINNGWFYDKKGCPAFFTDNSIGGPARPARGAREARPARPARTSSWSNISSDRYFYQ